MSELDTPCYKYSQGMDGWMIKNINFFHQRQLCTLPYTIKYVTEYEVKDFRCSIHQKTLTKLQILLRLFIK